MIEFAKIRENIVLHCMYFALSFVDSVNLFLKLWFIMNVIFPTTVYFVKQFPYFISEFVSFQFILQAIGSMVSRPLLALGLGGNDFGPSIFFDRNPSVCGLCFSRLHILCRRTTATTTTDNNTRRRSVIIIFDTHEKVPKFILNYFY